MSKLSDLAARLEVKQSHYECEDCWYSCATLTCNEGRSSDVCDCGADQTNAMNAEISAALREAEQLLREMIVVDDGSTEDFDDELNRISALIG